MCTKVMVCHGDRSVVLTTVYPKKTRANMRKDKQPATYYITRDGKYAVDADYVSVADLESKDFDLSRVPKIPLAELG
ncbi:MAG TPA: hypothetical protein VFV80_09815 [Geminicoccaceae bacterium]|nr:hypothetical protein [Geminicoccaceae bacterium]